MTRRGTGALTASPVLVGAVTVLVAIVAVFLSYNANTGLPFVPTYDLKANLPNAAQLVRGFEVRIGGARVGQVSTIEAKQRDDGSTYAQVTMKLDKEIEPLPNDTELLVRPRSALGLKYVELRPGRSEEGLESGATVPIERARPEVVEFDDFFNMFDAKARVGSRSSLNGYGGGLAGRGTDLNTAIFALRPLLEDLEPVAANLADPETGLDRFFVELADAAGEAAPVAEQQAELFVNLDVTFTALSSIARPYLQETITEGARSEEVAIREFPVQRPFLRNNAAFFRELRPGRGHAPGLGAAPGGRVRGGHRGASEDAADEPRPGGRVRRAGRVLRGPAGAPGDRPAHQAVLLAAAHAGLPHPAPDHLQLRDAVLPQRGERAVGRRRQRHVAALRDHPHAGGRATTRAAPRRRRPTAPRPRTTSTPTRTRTRRRRARRRSARRATSATCSATR